MKQAIKSIWRQAMREDVKVFRWFFVPALLIMVIGLVMMVISFGYLDYLVGKKAWGMEFILVPFEVAVIGFFHGLIILWGENE